MEREEVCRGLFTQVFTAPTLSKLQVNISFCFTPFFPSSLLSSRSFSLPLLSSRLPFFLLPLSCVLAPHVSLSSFFLIHLFFFAFSSSLFVIVFRFLFPIPERALIHLHHYVCRLQYSFCVAFFCDCVFFLSSFFLLFLRSLLCGAPRSCLFLFLRVASTLINHLFFLSNSKHAPFITCTFPRMFFVISSVFFDVLLLIVHYSSPLPFSPLRPLQSLSIFFSPSSCSTPNLSFSFFTVSLHLSSMVHTC